MENKEIEAQCKSICYDRLLYAILFSVIMQYIFLTIFLLFVNFSLFHPITWLFSSFSLLFQFYTWFYTMPLVTAVVVYGMFVAKTYLTEAKYYSTRFSMICNTFFETFVFMITHWIVGVLTIRLYSDYIRDDYKNLIYKCDNDYCLNEKHLFLIINGLFTGCYCFLKESLNNRNEVKFPVIQLPKHIRVRTNFFSTFYKSLTVMFIPTICFIIGFSILRSFIKNEFIYFLNLQEDELITDSFTTIIFDLRLLIYSWILSSQIISNMKLMKIIFNIFLTEYKEFPIEQSKIDDLTMVNALSIKKFSITRQLACLDLFILANGNNKLRRKQLFTLSIPGGHPYNWKKLWEESKNIITNYTIELSKSIKKIENNTKYDYDKRSLKPTATDMAEKLLLRQYNDSFGIRNMTMQEQQSQSGIDNNNTLFGDKGNQLIEYIYLKLMAFKISFMNIPGIYYFFGESDDNKTCYLLSQSQDIIWLCQGIAKLTTHSINEDKYGVVQTDLPIIIKIFLELKFVLDRITPIDLGRKKYDYNYIAIKNSIKRSLYQICTVFGDYIDDLTNDPNDLKILQNFVQYKEL